MIYPLTNNINFIVKSDMLTRSYTITNESDFYSLKISNHFQSLKPVVISELKRHESIVLCPSRLISSIDITDNSCLLNINTGNHIFVDLEYMMQTDIKEIDRILRIM